MEKPLEERVHELEREIEILRRKLDELEETVGNLYREMRTADEAQAFEH